MLSHLFCIDLNPLECLSEGTQVIEVLVVAHQFLYFSRGVLAWLVFSPVDVGMFMLLLLFRKTQYLSHTNCNRSNSSQKVYLLENSQKTHNMNTKVSHYPLWVHLKTPFQKRDKLYCIHPKDPITC